MTDSGTIEEALTRQIARADFAALPEQAVTAARRELLWFLGTAIAGAAAGGSAAIADYVRACGGTGEATVLGRAVKAPAHLAAMANSTFAKAYEYEDKLWIDSTHGFGIGMAVVPAVLAAAESAGGISGEELITAIAVATDFEARLLTSVLDVSFNTTGWNPAYVFAVFGATAGAAKALALPESALADALGLAYAQAAGNYQGQIEGVLGVRMQLGFAVRNALMSCGLAERGITGVRQWLTGRRGLYNVHYADRDKDEKSVTSDLGTEFRGTRLGFKGYPCGLVTHAALDSLLGLRPALGDRDITEIRVFGDAHLRIMSEPAEERRNPHNFIAAQFSIPWAIACLIVDGALTLSHFSAAALADKRYRSLAAKVSVDAQPGRAESWVEIAFADGSTIIGPWVRVPRGHPDNPLTDAEIAEVYRDCLTWAGQSGLSVPPGSLTVPEIVFGDGGLPDSRTLLALFT
jgi:2-methylcitrate dehydratase PrpD